MPSIKKRRYSRHYSIHHTVKRCPLCIDGRADAWYKTVKEWVNNQPSDLLKIRINCENVPNSALLKVMAEHFSKIERLQLCYCTNLNDETLFTLVNICSCLKDMRIHRYRHLTDKSFAVLMKLCPNLRSVELYGCANITPAIMTLLSKSSLETIHAW
jgi:hypothetical protein